MIINKRKNMKAQKFFGCAFLAVALSFSAFSFANGKVETEVLSNGDDTEKVSYRMPEGTFVLSTEGYRHEVSVENGTVEKWTVNGRTLEKREYPNGYVFFYGSNCGNDATEFVERMQQIGGVCLQKISADNHDGKKGVVVLYDKTANPWCELLGEL